MFGKKVLIVDDDMDSIKILTEILETEGHQIEFVRDGDLATEIIENSTMFDLILLDIMMPNKNGIEVIIELRKKNITTPIIVMSSGDAFVFRLAKLQGITSGINKPLTKNSVLKKVNFILKNAAYKYYES